MGKHLAGGSIAGPRFAAVLLAVVSSCGVARAEETAPAPAPAEHAAGIVLDPNVKDLLPPPAPGRVVIADARTLVFQGLERPKSVADLDAEEAAVLREINRSPSTWQCYLLYTQEDLPEKLFHPGFTIVLDRPKPNRSSEARAEVAPRQ